MTNNDSVKVTYEKVGTFRRAYEGYQQMTKGQMSKFSYVLQKEYTKLKPIEDELQDKFRDIEIDKAKKDRDGFIEMVKTEKGEGDKYKYTDQGIREMAKAKRELLNTLIDAPSMVFQNIETELPTNVDFNYWEAFQPFVLPEEPSPELLEKLIARAAGKAIPVAKPETVNQN